MKFFNNFNRVSRENELLMGFLAKNGLKLWFLSPEESNFEFCRPTMDFTVSIWLLKPLRSTKLGLEHFYT